MIKTSDDAGNVKYTYVKCPGCGSKKKHFEDISNKAIKMGVAKTGYLTALGYETQHVGMPSLIAIAPLGSEIPTITYALEICKACGMVYSPMVITGKAKKALTTPGEEKKKAGQTRLWRPGDPQ